MLGSPHDDKHFQLALLFLIKPKLRRRSIRTLEESPADVNKSYEHGLSDREEQIIRYNMFGRDRGAVDTPGMNRLLKSTLELGYSQPGKSCKKKRFPVMRRRAHSTSAALNRSMSEAQERRTDIERCHLGLPLNLMMPAINHARARFGPPCCSRSHVAYPPTSAQLPEVPLSSVFEDDSDLDSPPPELLTELEIDGVDPPRKVTPIKTKASDGELPRITTYLEAAAFTARRAKSPDRPQAPNDAPPRPPKSYAEWMAFKAFRNEPADIFINYFYLLDPLTSHLCAKGRRPQESNLQPGPELSPDANDRYEAQFASLSSSGGETAKGLTSGTRPIPIPYPNAKAMMFPFSSQGGKLAKRPY